MTQQDHLRIKCGWRDNLLLDAREVLLSTANPSKASRQTLVRPWPFALRLPFHVDNIFESRQAKCSSVSRRRSSHHVHVYLLVFLCSAQEAPNGYVQHPDAKLFDAKEFTGVYSSISFLLISTLPSRAMAKNQCREKTGMLNKGCLRPPSVTLNLAPYSDLFSGSPIHISK